MRTLLKIVLVVVLVLEQSPSTTMRTRANFQSFFATLVYLPVLDYRSGLCGNHRETSEQYRSYEEPNFRFSPGSSQNTTNRWNPAAIVAAIQPNVAD
jgi:hypothetical protein